MIEAFADRRVLADVDGVRLNLALPDALDALDAGATMRLRVVQTNPALVFELIDVDAAHDAALDAAVDIDPDADVKHGRSVAAASADAITHLSRDARSARTISIRFDRPLVDAAAADMADVDAAGNSAAGLPADDAGSKTTDLDRPLDRHLDDAYPRTAGATIDNGPTRSSSAAAGHADAGTAGAAGVLPVIVLHGPAWTSQQIELVIRRERDDEAVDNAALDAWCTDLSVDLPALGAIDARLAWTTSGLRVRVDAHRAGAAEALRDSAAQFAATLADLPMRLAGLAIHESR